MRVSRTAPPRRGWCKASAQLTRNHPSGIAEQESDRAGAGVPHKSRSDTAIGGHQTAATNFFNPFRMPLNDDPPAPEDVGIDLLHGSNWLAVKQSWPAMRYDTGSCGLIRR